MPDRGSLISVGERIERLLEEVRSMASPPAWERVDELIRLILELYGSGLDRIMEIVAETGEGGDILIDRFGRDELIASLLILHGLHPENFAARVNKALVRVRPYLGSHGGDIELLEAEPASGVVRLRMGGSCESCPSSTVTVKLAVESAIRELAPEASKIEVEGVPIERPAANGIGRAPAWTALADAPQVAPGSAAMAEVGGVRIMLCRVGQSLYAYRDSCPVCASQIHDGELAGALLTCPSCGNRYDVRFAGRCSGGRDVHLEPVPLLADEAGVRVALEASPA